MAAAAVVVVVVPGVMVGRLGEIYVVVDSVVVAAALAEKNEVAGKSTLSI